MNNTTGVSPSIHKVHIATQRVGSDHVITADSYRPSESHSLPTPARNIAQLANKLANNLCQY